MSRVETTVLQVVQQSGPLAFERVAGYTTQVARQLADMHRVGKLYCDVRPGNTVVANRGVVHLRESQFTTIENEERIADEADIHMEALSESVSYLAPERALDSGKADARADIYSLGCMMYFMLVGKPPFTSGTIAERLLAHQTSKEVAITSLRSDAPQSLVEICETMMSKRPDERYQSANAVVKALQES